MFQERDFNLGRKDWVASSHADELRTLKETYGELFPEEQQKEYLARHRDRYRVLY